MPRRSLTSSCSRTGRFSHDTLACNRRSLRHNNFMFPRLPTRHWLSPVCGKSIALLLAFVAWDRSSAAATAPLMELPIAGKVADITYDPLTDRHFIARTASDGLTTVATLNRDPIAVGPTLIQGSGPA